MTHASVAGHRPRGAGGPDPAVGRHRDRRGPDRRPRPGPRLSRRVTSTRMSDGSAIAWCASTSGRRSPRPRWSTCTTAGSSPRAAHPTTIDTDVLDGWQACRAALVEADPAAADAEVLACSSAGGGLRIAVVGNERLVTAEAGRRVALSSGGRVVHVRPGRSTPTRLAALARPGPTWCCWSAAPTAATARCCSPARRTLARGPLVGPGRGRRQRRRAGRGGRAARRSAGRRTSLADNVVPQIGVLRPESARARDPGDVPGPRHRRQAPLARDRSSSAMVRGATPDLVLTAVELLARGVPGPSSRARGTSSWSTSAGRPPTSTR